MEHLSTRIQVARVAAGLSVDDLAKRMGVSRRAVGFWENGDREPGARKLHALAAATGKPLDWFFEAAA